ncbi:hypothetical protein [Ralstonia pseudosolanacearum]
MSPRELSLKHYSIDLLGQYNDTGYDRILESVSGNQQVADSVDYFALRKS